jgi:hypothetical protein
MIGGKAMRLFEHKFPLNAIYAFKAKWLFEYKFTNDFSMFCMQYMLLKQNGSLNTNIH